MTFLSESRLWLSIGSTMVQFFWVGAVIALAALAVRLWVGDRPFVRHRLTLILGLLFVLSPLGLWALSYRVLMTPRPGVAGPSVQRGSLDDLDDPVWPAASGEPRQAARPPQPGLLEPIVTQVAAWGPLFWAAGSGLMLVSLAAGVGAVRRLRASAEPDGGRAQQVCDRLAAEIGFKRVPVACCEGLGSPMLVGLLRPMILLPAQTRGGWSDEQLEMVLVHELTHLSRRDNLVNLLQRIALAVLFFHPAAWRLARWARMDREARCDAVVLARIRRPAAYAELLLDMACARKLVLLSAAMAEHDLTIRIRQILQAGPRRRRGFASTGVALCLSGVLTISAAGRLLPPPRMTPPQRVTPTPRAPITRPDAAVKRVSVPQPAPAATASGPVARFRLTDQLGRPVSQAMVNTNMKWGCGVPGEGPTTPGFSTPDGSVLWQVPDLKNATLVPVLAYQPERHLAACAHIDPWGTIEPFDLVLQPTCNISFVLQIAGETDPKARVRAYIRLPGDKDAMLVRESMPNPGTFVFRLPPGDYELLGFGVGEPYRGSPSMVCFSVPADKAALDLGIISLKPINGPAR